MFLVKKSLVPPLSVAAVEARLAADLPVIREAPEPVLRSAPCHAPLLAEFLFRTWSHEADVRAGRARVRTVKIPEGGQSMPLPTVPNPNRGDTLEPGTPEWAHAWNNGHRCERCGHSCGSTNCHIQCCGTEHRHRHTIGSYCSGHPCPACRGEKHLIAPGAQEGTTGAQP